MSSSDDKPIVLAVDDEPNNLGFYQRALRSICHIITADNGADAIVLATEHDVRLVITDQRMPDMSGTEMLIRLEKVIPHVPKIIVTAYSDLGPTIRALNHSWLIRQLSKPIAAEELVTTVQLALDQGDSWTAMNRWLSKLQRENEELRTLNDGLRTVGHRLTNQREELEKKNQSLEEEQHQLREMALHDELTSLRNRRGFQEDLQGQFSLWQRHRTAASLLLLDLDQFKAINDQHGHPVGDQALQLVGSVLRQTTRSSDGCYRLGGDEFAVIIPEASDSAARHLAEKFRVSLERATPEDFPCAVSTSVGSCSLSERITHPDQWYALADSALYADKKRDRSAGPLPMKIALIGLPEATEARWQDLLSGEFGGVVTTFPTIDSVASRTENYDLCILGVEPSSAEAQTQQVREIQPGSALVISGPQLSLETLISALETAHIDSFLRDDAPPEELRTALRKFVGTAHASGIIDSQVRRQLEDRDKLRAEHQELLSRLADGEHSGGRVLDDTEMRRQILCEVERYRRYGQPVSMLIVELPVSSAPSQWLKETSEVISQVVRYVDSVSVDEPGRVRVLLPTTDFNEAEGARRRVEEALRALSLSDPCETQTLSFPRDQDEFIQ